MSTTIETYELKALKAVVTQGTFTAAAKMLGTDKAHVSRTISKLERKLGVRLLERSTRRLRVTEIGRDLFERATGILLALEEAQNSAAQSLASPAGTLKLTAGPEFGTLVVNRWIATYLRTYEDVSVQAEFTNRLTDIIHEGFDVAIRVGALPDSELSARKLGEIRYRFYASPDYLRKKPAPGHPDQLADHDLVVFSPRGEPVWTIVDGHESMKVTPKARYLVNNNQAALELAKEGIGISLLPSFVASDALEEGSLRVVLPDWGLVPAPVHAVFASSRYLAPKVRAFVDLARSSFDLGR